MPCNSSILILITLDGGVALHIQMIYYSREKITIALLFTWEYRSVLPIPIMHTIPEYLVAGNKVVWRAFIPQPRMFLALHGNHGVVDRTSSTRLGFAFGVHSNLSTDARNYSYVFAHILEKVARPNKNLASQLWALRFDL